MTTYDVSVTREGRWWMVSVPEIDQLTQARRLSEIEQAARELIAVTLDVPMSTVDVSVKVEQVGDIRDVSGRAEAILKERAQAAELNRRAVEQLQQLVIQLASAKVPVRDIGELLEISHQRAQQLVSEARTGTTRAPAKTAAVHGRGRTKAMPAAPRASKVSAKVAASTRAVAGKPKATKVPAGTHGRTTSKA